MQQSLFEGRLVGQIPLNHFLFLSALPDLGPAKLRVLLENAASFEDCLTHEVSSQLPAKAQKTLNEYRSQGESHPIVKKVLREKSRADELGIHILTWLDEAYPAMLMEAHSCPPVLYVKGSLDCLCLPQIAIVGSRNISRGGMDNTQSFGAQLAASGFGITSGLALGADAVAHRSALSVDGITIAVLGSGVDVVYPKRNARLYEDIIQNGGAVVSEFPLGTQPIAYNFPKRNRIISGLSMGVLVVEAALKSGSLITARLAKEQNREVFAVPGSIHNPLSRGCHALIKDGAKLVETAQDIVDELAGMIAFQRQKLNHAQFNLTSAPEISLSRTNGAQSESALLKYLDYDPISVDELVESSGKDVGSLLAELLQLEIEGAIIKNNNKYTLAK